MQDTQSIKWAPVIPLIGGLAIGAEQAIGHAPEFICSYTPFWDLNDCHYVNYQRKTLGRPAMEYFLIDKGEKPRSEIDLAVCVPPCAGLSQLNTSKNAKRAGVGCQQNEWMYLSAEYAIQQLKAKVIVGENAPHLYTTRGRPVAEKLYEIADRHGYSLTLFYTNTKLHGIPQNRQRTFYILWKDSRAHLLRSSGVSPRQNFADYLHGMPQNLLHHRVPEDETCPNMIERDPCWKFLRDHFSLKTNERVRELLLEFEIQSTKRFVMSNNLLEKAILWANENGTEKDQNILNLYKKKQGMGLGSWNHTCHVFKDCMNAVITKNVAGTPHPTEDRSLTFREVLYMMGMPNDFELVRTKKRWKAKYITQNVPVCTARYVISEAIQFFMSGGLQKTDYGFVYQNNLLKNAEVEQTYHPVKPQATLY
jgi:site-specific DNA-cytosine methylase